ncbi:MAG: N-acetyltransferase [Verrucomicrobiales bacterium]|nr:N-acetyltransferase [Verrucomicrobiales bacterium]
MRKKAAGKLALRAERRLDIPVIHQVVEAAFGRAAEANLVDALRRGGGLSLSAVATFDGRVIGNVAFSPVTIGAGDKVTPGLALAPAAVDPEFQGRGIGTRLIGWALEECRRMDHRLIVVLGHPRLYHRFGFKDAESCGILSPFPVPPEVFMVLELIPGAAKGCSGQVRYRPELSQ